MSIAGSTGCAIGAHKSATARHKIINQNKLLLEGQRTTNHLIESLGAAIHRKAAGQ